VGCSAGGHVVLAAQRTLVGFGKDWLRHLPACNYPQQTIQLRLGARGCFALLRAAAETSACLHVMDQRDQASDKLPQSIMARR